MTLSTSCLYAMRRWQSVQQDLQHYSSQQFSLRTCSWSSHYRLQSPFLLRIPSAHLSPSSWYRYPSPVWMKFWWNYSTLSPIFFTWIPCRSLPFYPYVPLLLSLYKYISLCLFFSVSSSTSFSILLSISSPAMPFLATHRGSISLLNLSLSPSALLLHSFIAYPLSLCCSTLSYYTLLLQLIWRSASYHQSLEEFLLGDHKLAILVKTSQQLQRSHLPLIHVVNYLLHWVYLPV